MKAKTTRRIVAALSVCLWAAVTHAQAPPGAQTRSQLQNNITSQFPSTGQGAITAQTLRTFLTQFTNSSVLWLSDLGTNVGAAFGAPLNGLGGLLGVGASYSLLTGYGTGVATALGIATGTAGSLITNGGPAGEPSAIDLGNATGLPCATGIASVGTNVCNAIGNTLNGANGLLGYGGPASGLNYTPSGSGAVTRTVAAKLGDFLELEDYGGVSDGTTDNLAAWTAISSVISTNSAQVRFGSPGVYKFSAAITKTLGENVGLTLEGLGNGATKLYFPNATDGIDITYGSATSAPSIRDMTLLTGHAGSGNAITLTQNTTTACWNSSNFAAQSSVISNVLAEGFDASTATGGAPWSDYWADGLKISAVSFVNVDNFTAYGSPASPAGVGIDWAGTTSPACFAIVLNVDKSSFFWNNVGFQYGTMAQGATITNTQFTAGGTGVFVPSGTLQVQLNIGPGDQFNDINNNVNIVGDIGSVLASDSLYYTPTGNNSILIGAGNMFTITGNQFLPVSAGSGAGIAVSGNTGVGIIGDNLFSNLGAAIDLLSGATGWTIAPNAYVANTANLIDSAPNTIYPDSAPIGGASGAAIASGATQFVTTFASATEGQVIIPASRKQQVKGLGVFLSVAPGAGNNVTATFRVNGSSTALTCVVANANQFCSDSTHAIFMNAADQYDVQLVSSASAASTFAQWGAATALSP